MTQVGFVGLGIMGEPMARNILGKGFALHVYNRTAAKAAALVDAGAVAHPTPAAVAAAASVVICMVTDAPDVEQVVAGPSGVLEGLQPGAIVINMSTVAPQTEQPLAARVQARGGFYLDAPVSGGDVGARAGKLAIMVGGDAAALERARPVLACMGAQITHCGGVGAGQATKLCNQILVGVNLLATCEAVQFARKMGLDPQAMIEAVGGGAAGSWQLAAARAGPTAGARRCGAGLSHRSDAEGPAGGHAERIRLGHLPGGDGAGAAAAHQRAGARRWAAGDAGVDSGAGAALEAVDTSWHTESGTPE